MTDEKEKTKNYQTEFSFSFNKFADRVQDAIGSTLGSIGEEPETAYFEERLGSEKDAKILVKGGIGKLHVHPGEDAALLAKVETRHVGKMHFSAETDGTGTTKTVKIENQVMKGGFRGILGGIGKRDLFVDVALAGSLPLDVKVENGVGESLLDLRSLHLTNFKLEGSVGPATVYLPDGDYKVAIDVGVGPANVNLPASTGNKVRVEGGVGPLTVNVEPNADLTIDAEGGVGPVVFNIPAGTPLMVEYESGLGPFSRPSGMVQKSKHVWHTEGYDLAERSVYIKLEGGVGPSRINFVTPEGDVLPGEKEKKKTDFV